MSNCPICRCSMLKFNLKKYGMCFTCYMKNKMSENNCGGTAKGSGNSELGNNSEESHITTSSQESSPQEREILERIDICLNQWKQYKEANVWHCPYDKDKCEEVKQAREEMLKEIPCPQMTNSSISECVCEWCKSFKEEKLEKGGKK